MNHHYNSLTIHYYYNNKDGDQLLVMEPVKINEGLESFIKTAEEKSVMLRLAAEILLKKADELDKFYVKHKEV
jgi:hypothetical protein